MVPRAADIDPDVAARLWELHVRYGYFDRAEIEAALGVDPPRGQWVCPGQYGPDGQWAPCCRGDAA